MFPKAKKFLDTTKSLGYPKNAREGSGKIFSQIFDTFALKIHLHQQISHLTDFRISSFLIYTSK